MLLNHHGGGSCWLRLKDFCDLIAFKNTYPNYSLQELKALANEMKMNRILENGIQLLSMFFLEDLTFNPTKTQSKIISFWGKANQYDKVIPKIKYKTIYYSLQDEKIGWFTYLSIQIKFYAIVNVIERKRLISFPKQYVYLNVFSKIASYLWRRVRINFQRD